MSAKIASEKVVVDGHEYTHEVYFIGGLRDAKTGELLPDEKQREIAASRSAMLRMSMRPAKK